jgi:hypothetical protein
VDLKSLKGYQKFSVLSKLSLSLDMIQVCVEAKTLTRIFILKEVLFVNMVSHRCTTISDTISPPNLAISARIADLSS